MTKGERFLSLTQEVLESAGWFSGRDVVREVEQWASVLDGTGFHMFDAAEKALREFGGLAVGQSGPGLECAREPFHLDPTLAQGEEDRFAEHAKTLGMALYPLGEAVGGHMFFAIAEDGRTFLLMEELRELAKSIDEALNCLVEGRRSVAVKGSGK